ncbi:MULTISPECIES: CGNR zinc finger domain-containing protein [unclassified Streptomyces]|uniref:CGNR zinc finger domain-containing protein n=1 Tax=unclassified Streptomyces TaxID=2593676 RepID=UPI001BE4F6FB|nr:MULTISPECIES: CGNR zinc finger domain-containing protein [unclassified Streptomyces]MBT2404550.1 CGNR zinc finger domain-containing protein [Streptomyces sp. ISL-21]MBT2459137.1 CGNR zinc finger domain-containing protein [Streptomyces sp. ISL-86]MBT2612722.1 CGNR zinc finger domain-containing protein [Streptomyces sp. ISL-87]
MSGRAPAPGGLALVEALVNTLSVDTGEDRLAGEFGLSGPVLAEAVELREALRGALLAHAGHPQPPGSLATLNRLLSGAPLAVTLTPDGVASLTPTGPPTLTTRMAQAVAESLAAGTWPRLKACAAEDCQWAYYDRSPAGRGRWCTMSVCGSRAKMRTYRARTAEA